MKKLSAKEHKKKLTSAKKWRESAKGKKYLTSYVRGKKGKKHTGVRVKKLASARKWRASVKGKKYLRGYLGEYTLGFRRQRTPIIVSSRVRRLA